MFEMTNASECHRDAVFVCGGDRFVVFDRSPETGVWTPIALGVTALFSVILSVRGLWSLQWRQRSRTDH
jgi:hypothetical protein